MVYSIKRKKANRSVLGRVVMSFADTFDVAYVMKHKFQLMKNSFIRICMTTDSLSSFSILKKDPVRHNDKKRLKLTLIPSKRFTEREK